MEQVYNQQDIVFQLLEMGFTKEQSESAFQNSPNKSIEGLILYLEAQQNSLSESNPVKQEINPDINSTEEKKEEKPFEQESQSISSMINQDFSKTLQSMGYNKNVSEKSLFLTQNLSLEKAIDWINENSKSPDFDEELRIVGQTEEQGPKLTKEEAAQKARELQQRIREKRLLREKEEELEKERNRIKGGRALTEAKRELEAQQRKRDIDAQMRQRREDDMAKQKVLMELERDREERFGKKAVANKPVAGPIQGPNKPQTPIDKIETFIKQMKIAYPNNLFPGASNTALKTIITYLENIIKNPIEEKFRKINLGNENFQKRCGNLMGGISILEECGFNEEGGFLLMKNPNVEFLKTVIPVLTKATTN